LSYGAIDLVRGLDGVTYFLEVNPLGQWLWIEDLTDVPISEAIIDWMEDPEPAYSLG
jgi:glutathione synthase/RimK-type ligase-like ATP-grasp enzyme